MSETTVRASGDVEVKQTSAEAHPRVREEAYQALVAWSIERHAEGLCPAQIYNLICESGWPREDAASALLTALPEAQHEQVLTLSRGAPDPDFSRSPSAVTIDGHTVQIVCDMREPRLVVFGNLLSADECSALMEQATARLQRSSVTADGTDSQVSAVRTSSGMFFDRSETPLQARIESRIAALLDWPVSHSEALHVLRYGKDQQYEPHHDYFEPADGACAPVFLRGGQRVGSLVIYLNAPELGGATVFPEIPMEVRAVQGNAVFFAYGKADASSRTLHGGAPVAEGEKWVAVKWFRQGRFD